MQRTVTLQPEGMGGRQVRLWLRVLHTPGLGLQAALPAQELVAGTTYLRRDPAGGQVHDICLANDVSLSRVHARIEVNETKQRVEIFDNGSRNGTFVNRVRLEPARGRLLFDGDIVRVGSTFLLLRYDSQEGAPTAIPELVGMAPSMALLRKRVATVAGDRASVLVLGETGTGKEVVAGAIHRLSGRSGPLIAVNCSAIPSELAESQFFGHSAGAFTGAKAHQGFFRAAARGTLFLDEVGDLPLELQPKLLRVLEDRSVTPVGTTERIAVDVRVIAATNQPLAQASQRGSFRQDLFARLSDVILELPPLRERREDILLLLSHASSGTLPELPPDVIEQMLSYDWPRNVREVFKIASHLRLFGADAALRSRLVMSPPSSSARPAEEDAAEGGSSEASDSRVRPPARKLPLPSRQELEELLRRHGGVIQEVAEELGCSRRQVGRWLEEHHIDRDRFRS